MLAVTREGLTAAQALDAYCGLWQVRRSVIDRLDASVVRFSGEARITPARFEERGLARHRHATLQSSRAYGLVAAIDDIVVHFTAGGEFIRLGSAPSQRVVHQCGADLYRGRLFFCGPNAWAEYWQVTGPRKNYISLARYVRAQA